MLIREGGGCLFNIFGLMGGSFSKGLFEVGCLLKHLQ